MSANRITVVVIALAAVAIVAVVTAGGGGDDEPRPAARDEAAGRHGADALEEKVKAEPVELPENPDDVSATERHALTRPANLRRALAVLDRRRRRVEGVFDGLRVAPGRIDTVIVHPDDRRTNIQVRADFSVPFESTHDFPTQQDFRKGGLTSRDVDLRAPARLLRGIDRQRSGSAARDVDYLVIGRDIIDLGIDVTAYMRIRTARPAISGSRAGGRWRSVERPAPR